ncbi:MAG: hypothetical protein NVSMB48_12780 [Marmoricola sp.]
MPTAPLRKPNRYELPLSNMVGAMVIVILFVLAFVIFRALNRDNSAVTPQHVNYLPQAAAARSAERLDVWAPPTLPVGWYATAARYDGGINPHWHLSATDGKHYLGIEEGLDGLDAELHLALQGTPISAGKVEINGVVWTVYTDSQGDYALGRSMPSKTPRYPEAIVVVGTTPPAAVRAYAASLTD